MPLARSKRGDVWRQGRSYAKLALFRHVCPFCRRGWAWALLGMSAAWRLCLPFAHLIAARRVSAFSLPSHASTYLHSSGRSSQRGVTTMSDTAASSINSVVVIVAMEGMCAYETCTASRSTSRDGTKGDDGDRGSVALFSTPAKTTHPARKAPAVVNMSTDRLCSRRRCCRGTIQR